MSASMFLYEPSVTVLVAAAAIAAVGARAAWQAIRTAAVLDRAVTRVCVAAGLSRLPITTSLEPSLQPTPESTVERVVEPAAEQAIEPAVERTVEPAAEQIVEPAVAQTVEPAAESPPRRPAKTMVSELRG